MTMLNSSPAGVLLHCFTSPISEVPLSTICPGKNLRTSASQWPTNVDGHTTREIGLIDASARIASLWERATATSACNVLPKPMSSFVASGR